MEKAKTRPVSNTVMISSIFLSVICLSGLIHVEMELTVHRQMLEVLNQQREEKLDNRDTAHEDKQPMMKIPYSESNKGEYCKSLRKQSIEKVRLPCKYSWNEER